MSEEKVVFYDFGEFWLDVTGYRLLKDGVPVQLTHKGFEILHELVSRRDRMLRKEELLNKIWQDCYVEEATLTQHIYMLRKVLQQNGKIYIETVPKSGYRFVAEVEEIIQEKAESKKQIENLYEERPEPIRDIKNDGKNEPEGIKEAEFLTVNDKNPTPKRAKFKMFIPVFTVFVVLAVFAGIFLYLRGGAISPDAKTSGIKTIAVLPFKQIAGKHDEKLGLGMADVLITKLGKGREIEVLPTSAIIRYAGGDVYDLTEVGKNLGADAILTGTIQHDQDLIRVTVQFYNVETRSFLWSEKFDEKVTNIFLLQDSIAERISETLALRVKGSAAQEAGKNYEIVKLNRMMR
jgi:DNA-binding winged helix-turn-helix (wHTH) protein/TolB-like protein